jgi:hypothetical protein
MPDDSLVDVIRGWIIALLAFSFILLSGTLVVYSFVKAEMNSQLNIIKEQNEKSINDRKNLNTEIEIIQQQNQRSIDDRKHLNFELENTRSSLKRIEKAVKTVTDIPPG